MKTMGKTFTEMYWPCFHLSPYLQLCFKGKIRFLFKFDFNEATRIGLHIKLVWITNFNFLTFDSFKNLGESGPIYLY